MLRSQKTTDRPQSISPIPESFCKQIRDSLLRYWQRGNLCASDLSTALFLAASGPKQYKWICLYFKHLSELESEGIRQKKAVFCLGISNSKLFKCPTVKPQLVAHKLTAPLSTVKHCEHGQSTNSCPHLAHPRVAQPDPNASRAMQGQSQVQAVTPYEHITGWVLLKFSWQAYACSGLHGTCLNNVGTS